MKFCKQVSLLIFPLILTGCNFESADKEGVIIDGYGTDAIWSSQQVSETLSITYGDGDLYKLEAVFYRGDSHLFGFFSVTDANILAGDQTSVYLATSGRESPNKGDYAFSFGANGIAASYIGIDGWSSREYTPDFAIKIDGGVGDSDRDYGYDLEFCIPYADIAMAKEAPVRLGLSLTNQSSSDLKTYVWNNHYHFVDINSINTYLYYRGTKFEVPSVPSYNADNDTTSYNYAGGIYGEQDLIAGVFRQDNNVMVRIKSSFESWDDGNVTLMFAKNVEKNSLDESVTAVTLNPLKGHLMRISRKDPAETETSLSQVNFLVSANIFIFSFQLESEFNGLLGFSFLKDANVMSFCGMTTDIVNPSSYLRISSGNVTYAGNNNQYDGKEDLTSYASSWIFIPEEQVSGLTYGQLDISVHRMDNLLKIKYSNQMPSWNSDEHLFITFDIGDQDRTDDSQNAYKLSLNPRRGTISEFKFNNQIDCSLEGIVFLISAREVTVEIDLSNYIDDARDIGLIAERSGTDLLQSCVNNDNTSSSGQLESYVRIGSDNSVILKAGEYAPYLDETDYYEQLGIIHSKENAYGTIFCDLGRKQEQLSIRFRHNDDSWYENSIFCIYIDGGPMNKSTRDENSMALRYNPATGIVRDFFYLGGSSLNEAIPQSALTIKMTRHYSYIGIDLSAISESYSSANIGFAVAVLTTSMEYDRAMYYSNNKIPNTGNPSTFFWLDPNNKISFYDTSLYYPENDSVAYFATTFTIPAASDSSGSVGKVFVKVYRKSGVFTFLFRNLDEAQWNPLHGLWVYFDANQTSTTRTTGNSWSLRTVPQSCAVKSYFRIGPGDMNTQITTGGIGMIKNETYCKITMSDLSVVSPAFATANIGLCFSNAIGNYGRSFSAPSPANPSLFHWYTADGEYGA